MSAIELKAPLIITIEDRGKNYSLTIARIPAKVWLRYFEGIQSTSENVNGKRVDSFESSSARLELLYATLTTAEGYALPNGKTNIAQVDGWKDMLPLGHRLAVANTLIVGRPSDPSDDEAIALGQESVYLDAVWSADASGKMRKFTGLRHNFRVPSVEQQRRISRDSTRSRVVGGSRNGKTIWLGAQATLVGLYDELIVSVEGYTVDGAAPDRDQVIEFMDAYHKVGAADALFAPASVKVDEDGD